MCHASYIKRSINMAWKEMGMMDWTAQIWMLWVVMSPLIPWHVSSQTHMKETLQGQSGEVTEYHMTLITYKNKLTPITCTTGVSKQVSMMVMTILGLPYARRLHSIFERQGWTIHDLEDLHLSRFPTRFGEAAKQNPVTHVQSHWNYMKYNRCMYI